jgi:hypothetical protein
MFRGTSLAKWLPILAIAILWGSHGNEAAAYLTTKCADGSDPACTNGILSLSGPPVGCNFFTRDERQNASTTIESDLFGDPDATDTEGVVTVKGTGKCGIIDPKTLQFTAGTGWFDYEINFNCTKKTKKGNNYNYSELYEQCSNPVSGSFKANTTLGYSGDFHEFLLYCAGGDPATDTEGAFADCFGAIGMDETLNFNTVKNKVCPKEGTRDAGELFDFSTFGDSEHPGTYRACVCWGDVNNGPVDCQVHGNSAEPFQFGGAGANDTVFEWLNPANGNPVIDLNGYNNKVNWVVHNSSGCPTENANLNSFLLCGGVKPVPHSIQVKGTDIYGKVIEGQCADSLTNLEADLGNLRDIFVTWQQDDKSQCVDSQAVTVIMSGQ